MLLPLSLSLCLGVLPASSGPMTFGASSVGSSCSVLSASRLAAGQLPLLLAVPVKPPDGGGAEPGPPSEPPETEDCAHLRWTYEELIIAKRDAEREIVQLEPLVEALAQELQLLRERQRDMEGAIRELQRRLESYDEEIVACHARHGDRLADAQNEVLRQINLVAGGSALAIIGCLATIAPPVSAAGVLACISGAGAMPAMLGDLQAAVAEYAAARHAFDTCIGDRERDLDPFAG